MDKKKNHSALKKLCIGLGVDLFGVADISAIKKEFALSAKAIAKLDRAVVMGMRLSQAVLAELEQQPTRLYFHHYRTVNALLDQTALKVCNLIQDKGFCALPIPASQIVDWEKQTAHLSHKKIGVLAGIGWLGRNNLLVNPKFGSQFRLVTTLTDMPLKADKPVKENCGTCRACVVVCPAKAIREKPEDFDHQLCFAKLKEFQKQHLVDQYVCGVCVNACRGKHQEHKK
ncbi:MAG: reductive dehalogenase domain-containing protein [Candidatus Omnitrophica bacterium]|nr:reductive dehalogenase domain-containing protein [Candidatus Omnitrophota bacterium]